MFSFDMVVIGPGPGGQNPTLAEAYKVAALDVTNKLHALSHVEAT